MLTKSCHSKLLIAAKVNFAGTWEPLAATLLISFTCTRPFFLLEPANPELWCPHDFAPTYLSKNRWLGPVLNCTIFEHSLKWGFQRISTCGIYATLQKLGRVNTMSNQAEPKTLELTVTKVVNDSDGIKLHDLAVRLYHGLMLEGYSVDGDEVYNIIYRMIDVGKLQEIKYVSSGSGRERSFLLPQGSIIIPTDSTQVEVPAILSDRPLKDDLEEFPPDSPTQA